MKTWMKLASILVLALAVVALGPAEGKSAEDPAAFYKGKVLTWVVPYSPGGGFDTWSRLLAPFLEKYTGSTVVVRNWPGAGGLVVTNHVYNKVKRDGLTLLIVAGPSIALNDVFDLKQAKYDFKRFSWIGRLTWYGSVFWVSKDIKSVDDARAKRQLLLGGSGQLARNSMRGCLTAEAFGLNNVKMITDYAGSSEINLAVIRGEINGTTLATSQATKYITAGEGTGLAIMSKKRHPALPKVPTYYEIGMTKKGKKWIDWFIEAEKSGRLVLTAPGVPKARLNFLQNAFRAVCNDKAFVARAGVMRGEPVAPLIGKEVVELGNRIMDLSKADVDELRYLVLKKYYK